MLLMPIIEPETFGLVSGADYRTGAAGESGQGQGGGCASLAGRSRAGLSNGGERFGKRRGSGRTASGGGPQLSAHRNHLVENYCQSQVLGANADFCSHQCVS
jgi:hypothetical protein